MTQCNQETQCLGQPTPPLERLYVALPGHPLYGRLVPILRRRTTATATHCLIEDPEHPTFCYQLLARWLSAEPPPAAVSAETSQPVITISLVALDRFVQLLLDKYLQGADESHENDTAHPGNADLAAHSGDAKSKAQ